ncbi:MAG: hypothetical protein PHN64_07925 [Desulfovibrionaceae bacterium]|nr:hypothetical protein [Desulfovibrionaceae bacterium]
MAQLHMTQLNDFRLLADQKGNITQTNAGLVQGKTGTWIKSALNIGTARQDNVNTLQALRQAIINEPRYAQVLNTAAAQLGNIDTKYPLSAAKVKQVLANLDTAVETLESANKGQTYAAIMHSLDTDTIKQVFVQAANEEHLNPNIADSLTPKQQTQFIKCMGDRIIAAQGDFHQPPNRAEIQAMVRDAAKEINTVNARLQNSPLRESSKNIIRDYMFDGGIMKPANDIIANIQRRETARANEQVAVEYSTPAPDGKFMQALTQQLKAAGLTENMPEGSALTNLHEHVQENIVHAGHHGDVALTPAMALATLQEGVQGYIDSVQAAKQLPDQTVSAFMQTLCQTKVGTLPPVYIQTLAAMGQQVHLQGLNPPQGFANLTQVGNALMNLIISLPSIDALPADMRGEGTVGRRQFLDILIGSAVANSHMNQDTMQNMYAQLTQGAGKDLKAHLSALYASAQATTTATILEDLAFALGEALRIPPEQIQQDFQAPMPVSATIGDGLAVRVANEAIPRLDAQKAGLIRDFQNVIAAETSKTILNEGTTVFSKDVKRHQPIMLNGVPVANNPAAVVLPVGVQDTDENRNRVLVQQALDKYTGLITGNPNADYSHATQDVKNKVNIITSLISQETEKLLLNASMKAIMPDYGDRLITAYHQVGGDVGTKNVSVTSDQAGNLTFSYEMDLPFNVAIINDRPVMLDKTTSRHKANMSFTVTQASLTTLANQDWQAFGQQGLQNIINMPAANLPNTMRLAFTGFEISSTVSMFADPNQD